MLLSLEALVAHEHLPYQINILRLHKLHSRHYHVHMQTPLSLRSEDFVDLDILICLDVLDLQILLHFGNFLT